MKQKIYISRIGIAAIIMAAGAIFKVNHWPAAANLLIAGTLILVFLFLPAALINNYKAEGNRQNKLLYIVTYITCFVVFSAMLFKIQHWPYAGLGLLLHSLSLMLYFFPYFWLLPRRTRISIFPIQFLSCFCLHLIQFFLHCLH